MGEVLIVGKTRKKLSACIGGVLLADSRAVRIHKANGSDLPLDTQVDVGQVWNITFEDQKHCRPPHTENINVKSAKFVRNQANLKDTLSQSLQIPITEGSPFKLYEGLVLSTGNSSGALYIGPTQVPGYSTTFWRLDANLVYAGKHYTYGHYKLAWVGFVDPISVVPAGTLVRISLATYYQPTYAPPGYYLQLSGWFF
jgi:hypothetical protein